MDQLNPNEQSSGLGKKMLLALLLIAAVAGAGISYALITKESPRELSMQANQDTPPTLTTDESALKGSFIGGKSKCFNFETSDIAKSEEREKEFIAKKTVFTTLKPGVNHVVTLEDRSVEDIMKGIGHQAKCVFVVYFGPGEDGREKKFYTYPKGPFSGTVEIKENEKEKFMIKAGRGLIIIVQGPAIAYGVSSGSEPIETSEEVDEKADGWFLLGMTAKNADEGLAVYKNRLVKSININTYLAWAKLTAGKNNDKNTETKESEVKTENAAAETEIETTFFEDILIAPPSDTPELGEPIKVKIKGKNLTSIKAVSFSEKDTLSAELLGAVGYEATIAITVQPNATEGEKHLIVDTGDKVFTIPVNVKYKKSKFNTPMISKIDYEAPIVASSDGSQIVTLEGEKLDMVEEVIFEDVNLTTTIVTPNTTSETLGFKIFSKNTIEPGSKKFKLKKEGKLHENKMEIIVVTSNDPAGKTKIDYVTPKQYKVGTGTLKIDAYGTNMANVAVNNILIAQKKQGKYVGDDPIYIFLSKNPKVAQSTDSHIAIEFEDTAKILTPGKYVIIFPINNDDKGAQKEIEILAHEKAPKITSVIPSILDWGLKNTNSIKISGENFDQYSKVYLAELNNFNTDVENNIDKPVAGQDVSVLSITPKEIKIEAGMPVSKNHQMWLIVENQFGKTRKNITFGNVEGKSPIIDTIAQQKISVTVNVPVKIEIQGKNLQDVTEVIIGKTNSQEAYIKTYGYKPVGEIKIINVSDKQIDVSLTPDLNLLMNKTDTFDIAIISENGMDWKKDILTIEKAQ